MIEVLWMFLSLVSAVPDGAQPPWPPPPQSRQPTAVQMELLRRGEVLEETIRENERGGSARVRAVFRAEPRAVWEVLGDCAANFRFVQGLRECEIEEQSDNHAVTRQVAKKHWLSPPLEYRFETRREPYEWIQIRLLDGDLKQMAGSWRFEDLGRGGLVLVTHEIGLQPKTPAPRWLVRRTLSRDLVEMVACLRFISGASLDAAGAESDRSHCPEEVPAQ